MLPRETTVFHKRTWSDLWTTGHPQKMSEVAKKGSQRWACRRCWGEKSLITGISERMLKGWVTKSNRGSSVRQAWGGGLGLGPTGGPSRRRHIIDYLEKSGCPAFLLDELTAEGLSVAILYFPICIRGSSLFLPILLQTALLLCQFLTSHRIMHVLLPQI